MPDLDLNEIAEGLGTDLATLLHRGTGVQTIEEWAKGEGTFFLAPSREEAREAAHNARKRRKLLQRLAPKAAARVLAADRDDDDKFARAILTEAEKDAVPEIKIHHPRVRTAPIVREDPPDERTITR